MLVEIGYHDNYADATWVEATWTPSPSNGPGLTEFFGLPFIYPMPRWKGTVTVLRHAEPAQLSLFHRNHLANMPDGAAVTVYGEWEGGT